MKGRPPLVIDGEQMTRTTRDGTKTVYAFQYDSTTTPHRLTTTTFRGSQNRTQRYILQIDPGFLRLASTTDGSQNFPKSFDEPRTLVETYKRVLTESTGNNASSKENAGPSAANSDHVVPQRSVRYRVVFIPDGSEQGIKTSEKISEHDRTVMLEFFKGAFRANGSVANDPASRWRR